MSPPSRRTPSSPRPLPLLLLLLAFALIPVALASPPPSYRPQLPLNSTTSSTRRWLALTRALNDAAEDYDCRPYGNCEACPKDQKSEPFCQPYGNRRLLHCVPKGHFHHADHPNEEETHEKEIPAWEACGKVIVKERNDYWEFVTANLLFFTLSMVVLLLRSRKLAGMQYRMLAARIGLPGTNVGAGGGGRFLGFNL